MFFLYLLSGLFLGWSLGANDAANLYGTAVGTRMIRFRTAAVTSSVFIILGAVFGGAGASHTLGRLGAVNALPGSFTVALAAALTVTWMTRARLPVSTSQAVVGAIIGWNLFSGSVTNLTSLSRIVTSWVLCPVLAAIFAVVLLFVAQTFLKVVPIHLFRLDWLTRAGLFLVGAFAAYSLGANNIANVVGVFVPASPFQDLDLWGVMTLSGAQQLFLIGSIAIAVGVFTYSRKVMLTVGSELFRMSPLAALIVVLAQALVLFLFASEELEAWLASQGLPTIPLVPVSSSQAVIGAVIGIGLAKGGRNIRFPMLGRVGSGWISTPLIACVVSFVALFFVQNVFSQQVYEGTRYEINHVVAHKLDAVGLFDESMEEFLNQEFEDAISFREALARVAPPDIPLNEVLEIAEVHPMEVDVEKLEPYWDYEWYSKEQMHAVFRLHGRRFRYAWQLDDALASMSSAWHFEPEAPENKLHNRAISEKLAHLHQVFEVEPADSGIAP